MKLKSRYNRGMGLVEVLVAGSIALIIMFGIGSAILDSQRAQKSVGLSQDAVFFSNQLTAIYSTICPLATTGYVYNPVTLATPQDISFGNIDLGTGSFLLEKNQAIPGTQLEVNNFRIKHLTDGSTFTIAGVNHQSHTAALYISYKKTGNLIGNRLTRDTVIGLSLARRLTDNVVTKCSLTGASAGGLSASEYTSIIENASQYSCETNGGTWVPDAAVGENKCQFPTECKIFGSYAVPPAGVVASAGFVNPLTGAYSCPAGSTPYQQGVVTAPSSCGKSCIDAEFAPVYTCMKCGVSAIVPPPPPPPDSCAALNGGSGCGIGEVCYPGPPATCVVIDFGFF